MLMMEDINMEKMIETIVFPNIRVKIDKLIKITNEYNFDDLVKAIYCINLCVNNRSVLESCLSLNACLIEYESKGDKEIKLFDDFKNFFERIYDILRPNATDDYTVEDFGDVRISYNNKFYRVIIGTGHNNVFACLNFLPMLAEQTHHEKELSLALEYYSNIINYFINENRNDNEGMKRFVLPSEELFNKVHEFFDNWLNKFDILELYQLMLSDESEIEKTHFVCKYDKIYPLYNVSLLVDLLDIWENETNLEQKISIANFGILNRVFRLFETDCSNECTMYAPAMVLPNQKYEPPQKPYTFIARSSHGCIIALNKDEYEEGQLEKEIEKIENYHKSDKLYIVEAYNRFNDKRLRGIHILPEMPLRFLIYNSNVNVNEICVSLGIKIEGRNIKIHTALDIIYFLDFSDDLDELFDYLTYSGENDYDRIIGFGSDASLFLTWKNQGHYIAKGALKFDMINIRYDTENFYVVDYFKQELKDYPFHLDDYLFREPFSWKVIKKDKRVYEYSNKYGMIFGGIFFTLPKNNYIFMTNNIKFYRNVKSVDENINRISLFEDIIIEGFSSIESIFENNESLSNCSIQLALMPIEYAKHAGHECFLNENRNYIYSDALFRKSKCMIRFVVKDIEKIFNDIHNSVDRTVEFLILREILYPIMIRIPNFKELFDNKIKKISQEKKKVDVISTSIGYKWNTSIISYRPNDYDYNEVRKRIAKICKKNGIQPGTYHGKKANEIIRSMQKSIIEDFESEVSKYSCKELYIKLLDYHSVLLHDININWKRYGAFTNLDEKKDKEIRDRIIKEREDAKFDDRIVLYLIETILYLNSETELYVNNDVIKFLIAYARWLVILNDVADMCHFAENDVHIEITQEYVVDALSNDKSLEERNNLLHRVYSYSKGLNRNNEIDVEYLKKTIDAFKNDIGFELGSLNDILTYFSLSFKESIVKKVGNNVFQILEKNFLEDFRKQTDDSFNENEVKKIIDYLTLNLEKLKTVCDKEDFYLPIGKRRTRDNRFEIRPIIKYGEGFIFSPIVMENLKKDWLNGIMDFILPYEIGMNQTKQMIKEWKKYYEKNIVFDLEKEFKSNGFNIVKVNFELHNLNKIHPKQLGDYDVFAVDNQNKTIVIVECKVIEKVATYYDMFRQQNRFFNEDKEDEKFQRRIDYLKENISQVLTDIGCPSNDRYKIFPFMCMSKVLKSRYKEIKFPIVAYSELVGIILNRKY